MNKAAIQDCLFKISHESDGKAFKEFYRYYFNRLFRFCITIVHSKEVAEEIVHDVFMNLWEKRNHLHKIENPDVYLYVAVKNKSLDYLSKNRLRETVDISTIGNEYFVFDIDPEKMMITEEMKKKIYQTIDQLPPCCKQIFCLIREDGLKYKEAAAILNLSVKTVESQMAIAMKKLITAILIYTSEETLEKNGGTVQ
jgi:RNA polymerase sigma-70 factor (ECF subfamily)